MLKKILLSGFLAITSLVISQNANGMDLVEERTSPEIKLLGSQIQSLLAITDYEVQIEGKPYRASATRGKHDSIIMGNGFNVYKYEFVSTLEYWGKRRIMARTHFPYSIMILFQKDGCGVLFS